MCNQPGVAPTLCNDFMALLAFLWIRIIIWQNSLLHCCSGIAASNVKHYLILHTWMLPLCIGYQTDSSMSAMVLPCTAGPMICRIEDGCKTTMYKCSFCKSLPIHAIFFIRNTMEFQLILFLKFSQNWTSFVAYLLLNFLKIFHSLFLRNMFYLSKIRFNFTA